LNSGEKTNGNRVVDIENVEGTIVPEVKTKKSLALKILALKCAAHLKWNFQLLESRYIKLLMVSICTRILYKCYL